MNIVLITTASRADLLSQTVTSLRQNAEVWSRHTLTVVDDAGRGISESTFSRHTAFVVNQCQLGASASRNIGASSIPKYRRKEHVMFIDDDVYMLPGWDAALEQRFQFAGLVLSGHAHPYNQPLGKYWAHPNSPELAVDAAGVLSTVHLVMPWSIWDDVGYFVEPGGPGGSEDVEWCARAVKKGYGLAVTDPMCVVHCGLTSSSGKQIVGYDLMVEQNKKLIESYGLTGKVVFA